MFLHLPERGRFKKDGNVLRPAINHRPAEGVEYIRSSEMVLIVEDLRDQYIQSCDTSVTSMHLAKNVIPHTGRAPSSAAGALIQTDRGPLVDVASQTVNTVLGQNDPWVLANLSAFNLSGFPSFLSSRFSSALSAIVANQIATVGGISDARVNHRICSGAGAVESILSNAWNHRCKEFEGTTKKRNVATFKGGFHGQTGDAGRISWIQKGLRLPFRERGEQDGNVLFLEMPSHRGFENDDVLCPKDTSIIEQIRKERDEIFLVMLEPIFMNYGAVTPSKRFLRELRSVCDECGIPLAFDEVQTAYGWLGTMSAAEKTGVVPDMLAVSKGLTSGYGPLGASICASKYSQESGTGESTNGSDVRSLIAAKSVFERLHGIPEECIPQSVPDKLAFELQEGLLPRAVAVAEVLDQRLRDLSEKYPSVTGTPRGEGLIRALPVGSPANASTLYHDLIERGVFARASHDALVIKPPIVITDDQLNFSFEQIEKSLRSLS